MGKNKRKLSIVICLLFAVALIAGAVNVLLFQRAQTEKAEHAATAASADLLDDIGVSTDVTSVISVIEPEDLAVKPVITGEEGIVTSLMETEGYVVSETMSAEDLIKSVNDHIPNVASFKGSITGAAMLMINAINVDGSVNTAVETKFVTQQMDQSYLMGVGTGDAHFEGEFVLSAMGSETTSRIESYLSVIENTPMIFQTNNVDLMDSVWISQVLDVPSEDIYQSVNMVDPEKTMVLENDTNYLMLNSEPMEVSPGAAGFTFLISVDPSLWLPCNVAWLIDKETMLPVRFETYMPSGVNLESGTDLVYCAIQYTIDETFADNQFEIPEEVFANAVFNETEHDHKHYEGDGHDHSAEELEGIDPDQLIDMFPESGEEEIPVEEEEHNHEHTEEEPIEEESNGSNE